MEYDKIKEIAEILKACKKPLIVMPKNPDPDTLGASLGLVLAMKKMKKEPRIVSSTKISRKYEFLEEYGSIKREIENKCEYCVSIELNTEDIRAINAEKLPDSVKIRISAGFDSIKTDTIKLSVRDTASDLIITVSVPKLELAGRIYIDNKDIFESARIISINNSKDRGNYGAACVSAGPMTVSETVYAILSGIDALSIDAKISTPLLSGIIAGTKNFQAEKVGYQTFETASRLMANGANRDEVIRYLKRSNMPFYIIECYGGIAEKIGRSADISQALAKIEEFARSKKLNAAEKTVLIAMVAIFAAQNIRNSGDPENAGPNLESNSKFTKRNIVYAVDKLPISDETEISEKISTAEAAVSGNEVKNEAISAEKPGVQNAENLPIRSEISEPKTLKISDIKINAKIQYVGLNEDGSVGVPSNEKDVAWYMFGARPGEAGNAVIVGHRDSVTNPNGVFRRLDDLKIGALIEVMDANGNALKFKVVKKAAYDDNNSPIKEIFGNTEKKMLNLITCSGAWNERTNNYTKRIVVYSELAE